MKKGIKIGVCLVAAIVLFTVIYNVLVTSNADGKTHDENAIEDQPELYEYYPGKYLNSVAGHDERDTIVGNFTGKGIDTIFVCWESHYPEKNEYDQSTSYYAKSNNPELPTIELWGCDEVSPKLVYEGDVDGDGKDEWGYLHTWMNSQWRAYRIYTLVGNEWRYLISPTNAILNTDETLRSSGLEVVEKGDKKGYIKVHFSYGTVDNAIFDTIVAATYDKITKDNK